MTIGTTGNQTGRRSIYTRFLVWAVVIVTVPIVAMLLEGTDMKDKQWDIFVKNDTGADIDLSVHIHTIFFEGLKLEPGSKTFGFGLKTVPDHVELSWSGEDGNHSETVNITIPDDIDRTRFFAINLSIAKDNKATLHVTQ